jgi:carotenoid cleavage dioxygenase
LPGWVGLLPWLVFGVAQEWSVIWPAPLALAVFILLYWPVRQALPPLDAGVAVYFLIYSIICLAGLQNKMPPQFLFALCPAVLAITAAFSVLLGRPFTLAYAFPYTPEHIRVRRAFFFGNQVISLFWAVGFTVAAVAICTLPAEWKPAQAGLTLISVLGATAAVSAAIGLWFHLRQSRIAT